MCLSNTNMDFLWIYWFWKLYSQMLDLKFGSDIVGIKGNNVAVAGLVAVDDYTKAEFKGHVAVTDSVVVHTATETGSMVIEAAAWLWVS